MNRKKIAIIAISFLVLIIGFEIFTQINLHQRPERNLAESFIQSNGQIIKIFGQDVRTKFLREGSSFTNYSSRPTELVFRFKVTGKQDSGFVNIIGEKKENKEFKVKQITSSNDFEQSRVIWKLTENK